MLIWQPGSLTASLAKAYYLKGLHRWHYLRFIVYIPSAPRSHRESLDCDFEAAMGLAEAIQGYQTHRPLIRLEVCS